MNEEMPLFRHYPLLKKRLPQIALATLPTPVEKLTRVGKALGLSHLYIKRDDQSGTIYGGNKVRKLEFLLGDALRLKAKEVITFGFAGSNHALATAIYAQQLGLKCTSFLMPQVNAHYVRRNLLASHYHNAELRHCANPALLFLALSKKLLPDIFKRTIKMIPAGGSCPLGVIGYVNAAFELRDQILAGFLPEPDRIYVPMGSMGTSAGLTLGLKAAGLKSLVIPVRVIEEKMARTQKMRQLAGKTNSLLCKLAPTFPRVTFTRDDFGVRNNCLGLGYARFTEKAVAAAEHMKKTEGIILNGAYSAKAFSALVDDAEGKIPLGETVLFWNTYNSRDLSAMTASLDHRHLPQAFHHYFEKEVQELDINGPDR